MTDKKENTLGGCLQETAEITNMMTSVKFPREEPTFSNMPIEILTEVVNKLEPINRLVLQKVSRKLREFVNNMNPGIAFLRIDFTADWARLMVDKYEIICSKTGKSCQLKLLDEEKHELRKKTIEKYYYSDIILNDWRAIITKPKLRLNELYICLLSGGRTRLNSLQDIENILQTMKPLPVKHIHLLGYLFSELPVVFQHFQPGVLENIRLHSYQVTDDLTDLVTTSEQWNKAKSLEITGYCTLPKEMENLFHFEHFQLLLTQFSKTDASNVKKVIFI